MFERSTSDARPDQPGTHRCIAATSCHATITEDGEKQPAYTEQPDTLCDGCTAHYRDAIKRLIRDHAMLRVTLGEHQARQGETVTSSPTPTILIDATSDRLMTEILEWASYAADLISEKLGRTLRDGSRVLPAQIHLDELGSVDLKPGSLAEITWEETQPAETERLNAYLKTIEPNLNVLAQLPPQDVQIWSQPKRCPIHSEQIVTSKRMLVLARNIRDHSEITEATALLQKAYAAAGICNDCCGYSADGRYQARQDVTMSGLDVLNRLARTHQLARRHLGHTKVRHRYSMPCPRCGSPVGRDDGTNIVTCENDQCILTHGKWGPSSWTEREYKYLAGRVADEQYNTAAMKYLLAEAYSRIDGLQELLDKLDGDTTIDTAGAGRLILDKLTELVAGHVKPDARKTSTDKAAALIRQEAEDNWAWKREPKYVKPKKKPGKPVRDDVPKYAQSSLSTLVEPPVNSVELRMPPACKDCNLVHRGECG